MPRAIKIILFFLRNSLRLGKKQLKRSETIVSYGGFAISVAILTASLTLLDGYQRTLKEGLLGVNAHIYIYDTGEKLSENEIARLEGFLENQPEVKSFTPVMMTQIMATGERQVRGAIARSMDWEHPDPPTNYHRYINRGTGELSDRYDAVIGSGLASFLQIDVGDKLNLISPANMQYTIFGLQTGTISVDVKGIYHSGIYDSDSRTVFLNREVLSTLRYTREDTVVDTAEVYYDLVEVKLIDEHVNRADYLIYLWNMMLDNEFIIYSWIDYNSNLFTMLVVQKWVIGIILSFLVLIASFNIISNTTTSIMERKKDIGILKATGCNNGILKAFFLSKTMILSLIAILSGVGAGLLLAYLLTKQTYLMLKGDVYFIEQFTIQPDIQIITVTVAVSLVIALWATLISLRKISSLTIVEAIRN
jgi:lipoprotein-releasing system permease protein